ncbi:ATP-grasp domain-containing protein [Azospira inquinata]|uniref:Glutathione synthase n=1 Tax=Azospira inquinata TaxID=2785627 RepID=A0A975XVX4_9RHOO|nr:hypothetical protein [Azospira inquinata]QWT47121.1 hypothetical protein J8L76_05275 [Azospira inquinata]QWT50250.1 hypothetical protein Azoinq_06595 [Azospira inquinata]
MSLILPVTPSQNRTPFLGLAPFLRRSIAGEDLRPACQDLLARAQADENDPELWMNLATVLFCLQQRDLGLAAQSQALAMSRVYVREASQPARLRLLVLVAPGDLAANTPLDCLLEDSDVTLIFYYLTPGNPLAVPVPDHDAVLVGVTEADEYRSLLIALELLLARWPRPVLNGPAAILRTGREAASNLFQDIPGLMAPRVSRVPRRLLTAVAQGQLPPGALSTVVGAGNEPFPCILRPVGSHAGHGLDYLPGPEALAGYLAANPEVTSFFHAPFVDYRGPDGLYRKYRVVLVEGEPYPGHLGVSDHWMIHYVNAGMYEDGAKREEERAFMEGFDAFAARHGAALKEIARRVGLDYLCLDCGETAEGRLLAFEVGNAMVVHAMDPVDTFPYKQAPMARVKNAFRALLARRAGTDPVTEAAP